MLHSVLMFSHQSAKCKDVRGSVYTVQLENPSIISIPTVSPFRFIFFPSSVFLLFISVFPIQIHFFLSVPGFVLLVFSFFSFFQTSCVLCGTKHILHLSFKLQTDRNSFIILRNSSECYTSLNNTGNIYVP